jgi:predicted DNA-binding transcriptional regulator AlpA
MAIQVSQHSETALGSAAPPPPLEPALKSREAARYIGMSDSWLRQSRMADRTDGPPFFRAGTRAIRYRRADLDRWLESRLYVLGKETQPVRIENEAAARALAPRAHARARLPKRKSRPATRLRRVRPDVRPESGVPPPLA